MRIDVVSVIVNNQDKAARFYTDKLGFTIKRDIPMGEARWLTLSSPEQPLGPELLIEPNNNPDIQINGKPAAQQYQRALYETGIPFTMFMVDDIDAEYQRLTANGVEFKGAPVEVPGGKNAVFDDTCGNLIALMEVSE